MQSSVTVVSQSHTVNNNRFLGSEEMEVSRVMRRTHFGILAEILQTAKDGAKQTRIMYDCNLNYRQTRRFVSYLLETGLLTIGNSYHTTEKGLRFLGAYQALKLLLDAKS